MGGGKKSVEIINKDYLDELSKQIKKQSYFEHKGRPKVKEDENQSFVRRYNFERKSNFSDEETFELIAKDLYNRAFNPDLNGINEKKIAIPNELVNQYKDWISNESFHVFSEIDEYGTSPFEYWLDYSNKKDFLHKYRIAEPNFENYSRKGKISKRILKEYEKIWSDLSEAEKEKVSDFAHNSKIPVATVVQLLSPQFYSYMKRTNTPFIITKGKFDNAPLRLSEIYISDFPGYENYDKRAMDIEYVYPYKKGKKKFEVDELDMLYNNILKIGNDYSLARGVVNSGAKGYYGGNGYNNPGVYYGTYRQEYASKYARSPVGTVHSVVVGGKPYIGDPYDSVSIPDIHNGEPVMNVFGRFINPERTTPADLEFLRKHGYDFMADFSVENQFIDNRPNKVKKIVGNNGRFSRFSKDWYGKKGGSLEYFPSITLEL